MSPFVCPYLKGSSDPAFIAGFDHNGDGFINNLDAFQFSKRYLLTLN